MKINCVKQDKIHLKDLITEVDSVYICDDVNDFYYTDEELFEDINGNTIQVDTIISKSDVEDILNKIKACNWLDVEHRPKNFKFIKKYNISPESARNILNQITVNDYVKNTTSRNSKHGGNNLIIFEPKNVNVDGKILNLIVYIKIDLDESTDTKAVAVSFHETNHEDLKPY